MNHFFKCLGLSAACAINVASANESDVNLIVSKANHVAFYQGVDGRAESRMLITDGGGNKQVRQFTILRKDRNEPDDADQDFLVLFSRPADVRNTMFRVIKHIGGSDDRWLYLPGLDLVKRISSGDKRTSFVGSHFFYEDISGRSLSADKHELLAGTEQHYVVKNTPLDPASVEFAFYTVWIDKGNWMPVKTEYTDSAGKVYRRIEALQIKDIDGFATATKMKASDLRSGGSTLTEMRYIHYGIGLPDDIFSERSLRNPPQQWFKRK
ncbi:MAG: outer membrane lipoprotein-sorting protein [Gammaproteobacteria bacterium]|nr:outer membrane lipoprotein-sorting protein [Gammaproteobacteria bacterium]MBQ0839591.1 outer membrane lipoprotein-sorting protein [Gammaproteobacteria bacterium]